MLNEVKIIGIVVKDPITIFPSNEARLSVETNDYTYDKNTGKKLDNIQRHNIVTNNSDFVSYINNNIYKYSKIIVKGSLQYSLCCNKMENDPYINYNKKDKYITEVKIESIRLLEDSEIYDNQPIKESSQDNIFNQAIRRRTRRNDIACDSSSTGKNDYTQEEFINLVFDDSCPESFKNSPAKIAIFNYLGKDESLTNKVHETIIMYKTDDFQYDSDKKYALMLDIESSLQNSNYSGEHHAKIILGIVLHPKCIKEYI